jgi:hypothetical protein
MAARQRKALMGKVVPFPTALMLARLTMAQRRWVVQKVAAMVKVGAEQETEAEPGVAMAAAVAVEADRVAEHWDFPAFNLSQDFHGRRPMVTSAP